jgi:hypothetical protein
MGLFSRHPALRSPVHCIRAPGRDAGVKFAVAAVAAGSLCLGIVQAAQAAEDNGDAGLDALASNFSISIGTDYQNGKDISLAIDQALKSRNRFQFSAGRSRIELSTGIQDAYTASAGMSTDPTRIHGYGVDVQASYLGPNLKSRSLAGSWTYSGEDWMFSVDPVARIISFYKPPPLPKTTDVFGFGTGLSATRYIGDAWSLAAGGEYYDYWGDASVLPAIIQIARSGGKLPYLSGYLRERYWLESGWDGTSSSFVLGVDSSLTVLSKQRVASAYLRSTFDLSPKLSLETDIGASNFESSKWYLVLGLSWRP